MMAINFNKFRSNGKEAVKSKRFARDQERLLRFESLETRELLDAAPIVSSSNDPLICVATLDESPTPIDVSSATLDRPVILGSDATDNSITVTWSSVDGATKYYVAYAPEGTTTFTQKSTTNCCFTLIGLESGVKYQFKVRAIVNGENTGFGDVATIQTTIVSTDLATPNASTTSVKPTSITAAWDAVDRALGYTLIYKEKTASAYTTIKLGVDVTSYRIAELTPGASYYWKVRAVGDGVYTTTSSYCGTIVETTPEQATIDPPTITNVEATGDAITAAWKAVEGAVKYYFAYAPEGSSSFTQKSTTDTSYTLTGLEGGETFQFKVRAVGDGGVWLNSTFGAIATGTTEIVQRDLSAPDAIATSTTSNSITVAWDAVANASGYTLIYKEKSESAYKTIKLGSTATKHTIPGLTTGATYYAKVRATGDGARYATSDYCETIIAIPSTSSATALSAPTYGAATTTADSITLNWRAVSGASKYTVEYAASGEETFTKKTIAGTSTSVTLSDLTPNTTYRYRIRTVGDGATRLTSRYGALATATTSNEKIDLAVPNAAIKSSGAGTITVAWDAVAHASGYTLIYKEKSETEYKTINLDATTTEYTIAGLTTGATYYAKVRSLGSGAYKTSAYCGTLTGKAAVVVNLSAPTILSTRATTKTIHFELSAVDHATKYVVAYAPLGGTSFTARSSTTPTVSVTDLAPGTTYQFKTRVVTDEEGYDNSAYSEVVTYATLKTPPRLPIPTIKETYVAKTCVDVVWDYVDDAVKYHVFYAPHGTEEWASRSVTSRYYGVAISGLQAGKTYDFKVRAVGDGEEYKTSLFSDIVTVKTLTTSVQLAKPIVTVSSRGETSVVVEWDDPLRSSGWTVRYRKTTETSYHFSFRAGCKNIAQIKNLDPKATYEVSVQNYHVDENYTSSEWSDPLYLYPLTTLNSPVVSLDSATNDSLTIRWTGISDSSGYTIRYKAKSDAEYKEIVVDPGQTSYTFAGLSANTLYYFRARANGNLTSTKSSAYSTLVKYQTNAVANAILELGDELFDELSEDYDALAVRF